MDFPKFVSVLHRRALFFPTAANLGDPFEGSYPAENVRLRTAWYGEDAAAALESQGHAEKLRRLESTLVSCWHTNSVESAAMWSLYADRGRGIAIRSTYRALTVCFETEQPIYVGQVSYLNYDTDPMPEGNLLDPFVHKRASFRHEQELRVVTERYVAPGTSVSWEISQGPPPYFGEYIPTQLDVLVTAVYLAPGSPAWFAEMLAATAERFGLSAPIVSSALDASPHY